MHDLRRRAAAQFQHHVGREIEPGQHEGRIDAALETIARVGIDAELAAGLRDIAGIPQRRFDQHVGGRLRTAGRLAAHDAGERLDTLLIGDDAHAVVERVGLAVERQQRFAVVRAAHGEIAAHLGGVEHVQRPAAVVGDEVRDVDQRVDRPKPDRGEPLLQPFRRRPVLDAAHQPQPERGTQRRRRAESSVTFDRAGEFALHRLDRGVLELAHVGRAEIAGDAVDAGAVGAVRREIDLDHRIVEPGPLRVSFSDRRVGRQFDDAFVIVGDLQFEFRAPACRGSRRRGWCRSPSVMFLPGMKAPGGENTPFMPARALGAPHTTWIGLPSPVSTMQTRSRSAFGMLLRPRPRCAMTNGASSFALSSTRSTSSPIMVSLSTISPQRRDRCRGAL